MPDYAGGAPMRIKRRQVTQLGPTTFRVDLTLTPMIPNPVVQSYTKTLDLGCFASTWPLAPGAGNAMIGGEVTRGASAVYTSINVPIGSTQAPNISCNAPDDVVGTDWTFVDSIMLDVGGNTCPMTFAWRIGAVSEPQVDRWQVSNRQRGHWIEMAGLDPGGPTVIMDGVTKNGDGNTFTSDDLSSPGAGWWFGLGGFMSDGPQDHLGSGNIVLAPRAPAIDLGLAGWTVGDDANGYRPYSWLAPLQVFGAGTDHIIMDRVAGTPNDPGADYRWLCIFWPLA